MAKLDQSGLDALYGKAREAGARRVILSSRSSEWEKSSEQSIREFFGKEPIVVRLQPFKEDEQRRLFAHHYSDEEFDAFEAEVEKFDLHELLGNPLFLRLFAEAYIESGRKFTSK